MPIRSRYQPGSALYPFADRIAVLELIWPIPLITLGILKIQTPVFSVIAVALALFPWLSRWLILGQPTRRAFMGGALGLLLVSGLVGVWSSYDQKLSWPLFLTLLGSVNLFFAIINTSVSRRWLARGLVVAAVLFAIYFVSQYGYFDYDTPETGRLAAVGRITGSLLPKIVFFTPHPNAAAAFLESVLLLSLMLAWRAGGVERTIWGIATAFIAYGLLISSSRGAWLGLAGALAIWLLLLLPSRNLRLAMAGLGVVGAGLAGYIITRPVLTGVALPGLTSFLETIQTRLTVYHNSLYLLGDYPFSGIGLGDTFALVYSRYQLLIPVPYLSYSHNLFLSVGLGLGGLGLMAFVWLLLSFYYFVLQAEQADEDAPSHLLFRAAWLGATVTFLHGLTDAPQFAGSGWTMPMLFGVLGLTVALGRPALDEEPENGDKDSAFYRPWRRWAWAAAVVLLSVVALIFWRPLLSAWYANLGALQQTQADLSPDIDDSTREIITKHAVTDFARALALVPTQPVANGRLGLMALDRDNFETAVFYLEQAYRQEPNNQVTLKALGYAYMWTGQPDLAQQLLQQRTDKDEVIEELNNWSSWRNSQGQTDLSKYAAEMAQRLSLAP